VGFSAQGATPAEKDLAGVVQASIAEHLMVLAANPQATPEVRAVAFAGVQQVDRLLNAPTLSSIGNHLKHEIELYLKNPQQNTPTINHSGAPPGPPV
jgi:hypothetical protein